MKTIELSPRVFWLCAAAAVALRLLLLSRQTMTLYPETSMLDDMLMVKAAQNILAGQWLGAYNYLTIGKHMLFPVWLALISKLGISYLLAGQLLYTAASAALVHSLAPAMKNRLWRLAFFVYLLFNPASYADFTLRVYRDNITVSFVMLVFAGFIGLALRAGDDKPRTMRRWGLLGGLALGCSWLLREDGGWLLPFCIVAAVVVLVFMLRAKPEKLAARIAALLIPFVAAGVCIACYSGMNYIHYGRFIVSDLTSREFQAAYGAMTRVVADEADDNPIVPIPKASRDKLAAASPLFASLAPYLDSRDFTRWQKDCGDGYLDYSGGGFYWAVRNAASLAGYYENADTARQFYIDLAAEINAACDSGAFASIGARSGLNSPITADRIGPTLAESLRGLYTVVTYANIDDSPQISTGSELVMDEIETFLHAEAKRTTKTATDDSRIVVWAFSPTSAVELALVDGSGNPVAAQIGLNTGSDIYLDELYARRDQRYTGACRRTVYIDRASLDGLQLQLTSADGGVTIPAAVTDAPQTTNDITYRVEYVGAGYDEQVTFGFVEIWLYRLMRVIVLLYRVANTALFAAAVVLGFAAFIRCTRRKMWRPALSMQFILALGLLGMAALRIGMVSFAEVSAFGIGTFPMYLAAVYPLLITFSFLGISFHHTVCTVQNTEESEP